MDDGEDEFGDMISTMSDIHGSRDDTTKFLAYTMRTSKISLHRFQFNSSLIQSHLRIRL